MAEQDPAKYFTGKRLGDYVSRNGDGRDPRDVVGRVFAGKDPNVDRKTIYVVEYPIRRSNGYAEIFSLSNVHMARHRFTLDHHLQNCEVNAEKIRELASSVGLRLCLDRVKFLPNGRVDVAAL